MILGIDPGIRKIGYALVENDKIIIAGALIDEFNNKRERNFERFVYIYNFFKDIFDNYPIKKVGIEKLYFSKNKINAEFVYGIRAIIITLAKLKNIEIIEINPKSLKKNLGNSKANKKYIQKIIENIYGINTNPHDIADALAICYLIK